MTDDDNFNRRIKALVKRKRRIQAVMEKLPVLPEKVGRIGELASDLITAALGDYPVSRGDNAAIRALDKLSAQFEMVCEALNTLPREAAVALEKSGGYSVAGQWTFLDFAWRLKAAKERLESKRVKKSAGRPESRLAFEVAREALRAYEVLTGTRAGITTSPTKRGHPRSGPFLDFLAEIFKVLDITASPESQAKKALASRSSPWLPDEYEALIAHVVAEASKATISPRRPKTTKQHLGFKQKSRH